MIPFRIEHLQYHIKQKLVSVQKHPEAELYIYNYTQNAQFDNVWNEVTLNCRGLILDKDYNIVARPFRKFFNYSELQENSNKGRIPVDETPILYDKMDGSLGIMYPLNNKFYIATRGSFVSDQAIRATKMLHNKYKWNPSPDMKYWLTNKTVLFEILYPENKIVVNYGAEEKLVQLAIVDRLGDMVLKYNDDKELLQEDLGFPIVKNYPEYLNMPFGELSKLNLDNKEGFVAFYPMSNFRMKIKFDEYVRLHRIITHVSTRTIWEYLKDGKDIKEMLENVPDEFFWWVKNKVKILEDKYFKINNDAVNTFLNIRNELDTLNITNEKEKKKWFALKVSEVVEDKKTHGIYFRMYDLRPFGDIIWKIIEPEFEKPVNNHDESNN